MAIIINTLKLGVFIITGSPSWTSSLVLSSTLRDEPSGSDSNESKVEGELLIAVLVRSFSESEGEG